MSAATLAAALCAAAGALAQEFRVTSPRAERLAVTIYRDGLALVTETRTVDLPAGPLTLVLEDVVETLVPQSATVRDAGRPLAEANFGFDRLTPRTLLERSLGRAVILTRTNPATGRVTRTEASVLAVGEGVLLGIGGGTEALYCAGLPERLELAAVPSELRGKPELSVRLAAGPAGPVTLRVSYLAHGFAWSSDYVAHLNERSDRLELKGWATLTNATGSEFAQAEVQLVAGRLNLLPAEEGGSAAEVGLPAAGVAAIAECERRVREAAARDVALLRECFATEVPDASMTLGPALLDAFALSRRREGAPEEIMLTAARAEREELGDYQLYRLPWRTDLAPRQTKQVLFLDEDAVRVERFYGLRLASFDGALGADVIVPSLTLRFENTARQGLGQPLPRGTVRVFERYAGRTVLAGEAELGDRPVGLPVELVIGRAQNALIEVSREWSDGPGARTTVAMEHRVVNNKGVPIDVEIRHAAAGFLTDARVERTSKPMRPKYGDFAWRFVVAPGEDVLSYRLSARERR